MEVDETKSSKRKKGNKKKQDDSALPQVLALSEEQLRVLSDFREKISTLVISIPDPDLAAWAKGALGTVSSAPLNLLFRYAMFAEVP